MEIRIAETDRDFQRAFELRYKVQVEELGRAVGTAGVTNLRDSMDSRAVILVAEDRGEIVGTVRKTFGSDGPLELEFEHEFHQFSPFYPDSCAMTSKLAVAPSHRGTSLTGKLAVACYEIGRQRGVRFDFVDTRPHLVRLYQQLGYRFFRSNFELEAAGSVVPMVLVSEDVSYLERVRSPFRRVAMRFENKNEARFFYEERFADYASILPAFCMDEDLLWSIWEQEIRKDGGVLGFFSGFSDEEARRFLKQLDPVDYPSGAVVVRQGDASEGMFCLLEGQAEVLVEAEKAAFVRVDILNAGGVFGEMNFVRSSKRNATVRTREPSKILVLTGSEFNKLGKNEPALALKLMTNLFATVVERFEAKQSELLKLRSEQGDP